MFSDIEGSTRLLAELGDRYEAELERHRDVMRKAFVRHGGVEVDTQGDAFFCAFARASDAAAAAEEAQRRLADGSLRVRIGLHTGEPKLGREGYVGMDVHRAARICSAGHGGQVLLSEATRDLLGKVRDEVALRDLGEHRLKDLTAPEHLYQLLGPALESEFPPLKTLDNRPTNLPVQPTPLVGRDRELHELQTLLGDDGTRLVTIVGPGGTGKTRLALQLAAEASEQFGAGVFVVFLAPIADPALVLPALAQALNLREAPGQDLVETLTEYLSERELLVVFDNFEHLLPAAIDIAGLLAAAPRLQLVVTSRAPIRIAGEREYALEPLPDADAEALFAERARAVRSDFDPAEHAEAVRAICKRLDCLPLALELAAARVRALTPESLLARLDSALEVLTSGARDADDRQRTLRATIEWSYDLLAKDEQAVFRRLAVFRGGWALEGAEAACDPQRELETSMLDALDRLVEHSLVRPGREMSGTARFFMLETIREFALEQLEAHGELAQVRQRHAEHITDLAEYGAVYFVGTVSTDWLERLDVERGNVLAALDWSSAQADDERFARLVGAVWHWWDVRGYLTEGMRWLEDARARPVRSTGVRDRILYGLFALARVQGATGLAMSAAEEGVELFHDGEHQVERARALGRLGLAYADLGEPEKAVAVFEEAVELARECGDPSALSIALVNLGDVALGQGAFERARDLCGQALEILERTGDVHGVCVARYDIGMAYLGENRVELAEPLFVDVLATAAGRGWQEGIVWPLEALATVALRRRDLERAARLLGAAQRVREHLGQGDERVVETTEEVRAALGEPAFSTEFEAGKALSTEEAVALELESRPNARW